MANPTGWGIQSWGAAFLLGTGPCFSSDGTPPLVSNPVPAPGTLRRATDTIGFDVTDNLGLIRRVIVLMSFSTGAPTECVHDGNGFMPGYQGSRSTITNGYRFVVSRQAGWPAASITVEVYPVDTSGNEP